MTKRQTPKRYHPALDAVREAVEGIDVACVGEAVEVLQARDMWPADDDRRGFWHNSERHASPPDVFDLVSIAAIGADVVQIAEECARELTRIALDMAGAALMFPRTSDVTWRPCPYGRHFHDTMRGTITASWLKQGQLMTLCKERAAVGLLSVGLRVSWPFGPSRGAALIVAGAPDRRAPKESASFVPLIVGPRGEPPDVVARWLYGEMKRGAEVSP